MARKPLKILVAGGFDPDAPEALEKDPSQIIEFTQSLGRQIIKQNHTLLTGCQTELDKVVAEAADAYMTGQNMPDSEKQRRIISYVLQGNKPVYEYGTIIESDRSDWDIGGVEPTPPEVVKYADVVILLGGFYGTFKAANWARLNRKPILPFAIFGGTAEQVYQEEMKRFDKVYSGNVERIAYEQVLRSLSTKWEELACKTVDLAERVVTSPCVFVVMSFKPDAQYQDLYDTIERVCKEFEYDAKRVDESNLFKRIVPEITKQIKQSAFVIADVSESSPNVFYEYGFADGIGKEIILLARKKTELPFDIRDVPVVYWESYKELAEELRRRIAVIGTWQGHA